MSSSSVDGHVERVVRFHALGDRGHLQDPRRVEPRDLALRLVREQVVVGIEVRVDHVGSDQRCGVAPVQLDLVLLAVDLTGGLEHRVQRREVRDLRGVPRLDRAHGDVVLDVAVLGVRDVPVVARRGLGQRALGVDEEAELRVGIAGLGVVGEQPLRVVPRPLVGLERPGFLLDGHDRCGGGVTGSARVDVLAARGQHAARPENTRRPSGRCGVTPRCRTLHRTVPSPCLLVPGSTRG